MIDCTDRAACEAGLAVVAAATNMTAVSVIIRRAELDRDGEALLSVQRAGYAVEATLIGVESLPPQHDTVDDLRAESLWVAEGEDGTICGLVGLENDDELSICRLVIRPDRMRRGVGRALVEHALALAAGRPVRVGTAAANTPALTLYRALGFEQDAHKIVGGNIPYVELRHPGARVTPSLAGDRPRRSS
jgi:ribosomal protein S18 acetylase RimI-like enzyme